MVLPSESAAEFKELEAALMEELAPEGALQAALAQRVVSAVWRLSRAERLEAELFERHHYPGGNLGLALIRDCNGGARSFDTLLRYRGGALAELWRALRTLKALQAERAIIVPATEAHARPAAKEEALGAPDRRADAARACQTPIEPEARGKPRETASVAAGGKAVATVIPVRPGQPPAHGQQPIEPETRGNTGDIAAAPATDAGRARPHSDLGAQVTQKCVTMRHSCATEASPPANGARSRAGAGGRT